MRFSTLAVFMLPLSALAAPSLLKRQAPASEADVERKNLDAALAATNDALVSMIKLANAIPKPDLVSATENAKQNLTNAVGEVKQINTINREGGNFSDVDDIEVKVLRNLLDGYSTTLGLKEQIKGDGQGSGNGQAADLVKLIDTANGLFANATISEINIIRIRKAGSS